MSTPVFNPNVPADHSPLASAEMRDQLNALKNQIDQLSAAVAQRAAKPMGIDFLQADITDPPTYDQVLALRDKMNELLLTLRG